MIFSDSSFVGAALLRARAGVNGQELSAAASHGQESHRQVS